MTKENVLFGIVGLLLGLILGFMITNSINRGAMTNTPTTANMLGGNSNIPAGHPDISGNGAGQTAGGMMPEVQSALEAANKEPKNYDAQIKAAELYYQIQQYDKAIEFLQKANGLKPDNYEVKVNLGNAYFDSNNFLEAEKWYSQALTQKADDVNVRTDLGLTFMFRETPDYPRAIQEFTRSLELDPNHKQTLQNLTVAYTRIGDAEKAKSTLVKLESIDATNTSLTKLREDIQKIGNAS